MAERWSCAASKTGRKLLPLLAGAEAVGCQLLWKEVSRVMFPGSGWTLLRRTYTPSQSCLLRKGMKWLGPSSHQVFMGLGPSP